MRQGLMLVGSYPPPYGGCSVHVERLRQALIDDFDVVVVDLYGARDGGAHSWLVRCGKSRPWNVLRALRALRRARPGIVHFHVAGMDAFLAAGYPMLAALPKRTRKIVTIHSGSFVARFERGPAWRRALLLRLLGRIDRIVTVSDAQRDFLERLGISAKKLAVVPAYLPPVALASPRVRELYDSIGPCSKVVVASGYGQPHYGYHVILDALERVRPAAGNTGLILCTYNTYDEAYMTELAARLSARGSSALVRDLGPGEFAWLMQRCNVYVRATDRDGDAVAVREAAYYGKVVIASDCVDRPVGTLSFRTGDARSLAEVFDTMSRVPHSDAPAAAESLDTLGALRAVYESALSA